MKPKILAILPSLIPSTLINVVTPLIDLHKAGKITAQVTLETLVQMKDILSNDLIIMCRNTDPDRASWFLNIIKEDKPYIYDIDDNFFELSEDTVIGKYYKAPERIAMLEQFIKHASLVRVYSVPMFERSVSLNRNTVQVTGPVDWRLLSPSIEEDDKKKVVKIVYATSRVKDNLAEIFIPALRKILEDYKDKVAVYFLGYIPLEFKSYQNVFFKPLNLNYEQYLRYFSSSGFDIGLAPLLGDIFHRSKSNLKVREYSACYIAGIYSNVDVYSKSITHRENGFLVENTTEDWYLAISELIENQVLRTRIKQKAYLFAKQNFSQEVFAQTWLNQITNLLYQPVKRENITETLTVLTNQKNDKTLVLSFFDRMRIKFEKKISTLISGLEAQGFEFIRHYLRTVLQTNWLLLKINLILLFNKKK